MPPKITEDSIRLHAWSLVLSATPMSPFLSFFGLFLLSLCALFVMCLSMSAITWRFRICIWFKRFTNKISLSLYFTSANNWKFYLNCTYHKSQDTNTTYYPRARYTGHLSYMKHSYLIYQCTGYLRKIMKFKFYVFTVRSHPLYGHPYTAISRKVVGQSARDNPERYCVLFWIHCSLKKFKRICTRGHGLMFASAKRKQQK